MNNKLEINTIRYYTGFYHIMMWGVICVVLLVSCCNIPYFIPSETIGYSNSHEIDTLYYEASAFGIENSKHKQRCFIYQAIRTDISTSLNPSDIVILQNGKQLKFKIAQAMPHKWKRIKQRTLLPAQSLIVFDTKAKTLYGDSITIVERNYPISGDSIVVTVRFDNYQTLSEGIYGKDSEVRKMLPTRNSLESEANRYMFEMMLQSHKDSLP